MSMTVKRRKDIETPRVLMHKIADIRGGVSIATSDLGGDYIPEGTVISAAVNGVHHVVKLGKVTAAVEAAATAIKVSKYHNFKVGDFVLAKTGDKAVAITAIDTTNKSYDTLTIGSALGAIAKDAYIAEAAAAATGADSSKSALKYAAQAVVGTGKPAEKGDNVITDAWVIGVTKGLALPDFIADGLKGIVNI